MSKFYLGIDTSNYTTSAAVFDSETHSIRQNKKLLSVKHGEIGLRQSEAVFQHVKQLPEVIEGLVRDGKSISAIGVSSRPRNIEGSYMPCFMVGETVAKSISSVGNIPVYETSHQVGHVLAALYSCRRLDLLESEKPFIAFHVSGGTTDCLLIKTDSEEVITATEISSSLDLKAGQLIDRVGVMLGLGFPCGKELEKLACESKAEFKPKATIRDGSCCLSGIENQCRDMFSNGKDSCDIALFALKSVEAAIYEMTICAIKKFGSLPVVYAGGVMSDKLIRVRLESDFDSYFAEPAFSQDNAAGVAIFAAIKDGCKPWV
ncbi:MAG: peptidase M22 [Oscillospiraceae bacterium]|nr:peptidase M22 [Oscillospiraceae bacterium]